MKTIGYAAQDAETPLALWPFERRDLRPDDVAVEILYCGVCHTDLHATRNDWGSTQYPCVPGHEIVGRVIEIGPGVTAHKAGDLVAVGTIVDSCGTCDQCTTGEERHCREGMTGTYGGRDRTDGSVTRGGYAKHIVVREHFVLPMPPGLDPARAAPLLCAGITVWSPLRDWNCGPSTRVGVTGLGGLGHLAVKLALGLGAEVTVISRTDTKKADALALGARNLLVSGDPQAMQRAANSFDLIIDTVPVLHDLSPYVPLLDITGALVLVGRAGPIDNFDLLPLLAGRRRLSGSPVGSIAQTKEMLEFCAAKNILPDCEMIAMGEVNEAFVRMEAADVRYRFVIDMGTLPSVA